MLCYIHGDLFWGAAVSARHAIRHIMLLQCQSLTRTPHAHSGALHNVPQELVDVHCFQQQEMPLGCRAVNSCWFSSRMTCLLITELPGLATANFMACPYESLTWLSPRAGP
jgi:hypothetical protein